MNVPSHVTVIAYRPNGVYSACRGSIHETSDSDFEIHTCDVYATHSAVQFMFNKQLRIIEHKEAGEFQFENYEFEILINGIPNYDLFHNTDFEHAARCKEIRESILAEYEKLINDYRNAIHQRKLDKAEKARLKREADEAEAKIRKDYEDAKIAVAFMKANGIEIPEKYKFLDK